MAKIKQYQFTQTAEEMQALLDKIAALPPTDVAAVTYAELTQLIAAGELVPGQRYRITDFVTMTNEAFGQSMGVRSAGHQFDVVVTASTESTLSEAATAMLHDGDAYFSNSDLTKWELKYSVTNSHVWADPNGRGVIYWMRDEWGNECGYDFKNIQYKRYRVESESGIPNLFYKGESPLLRALLQLDSNSYELWNFWSGYMLEPDLFAAYGDVFSSPIYEDGTRRFVIISQGANAIVAPVDGDGRWFYTFVDAESFSWMASDAVDATVAHSSVKGIRVESIDFFGTLMLPVTVCALMAPIDGGYDGTRIEAAANSLIHLSNERTEVHNVSGSYVKASGCNVNVAAVMRSCVHVSACDMTSAHVENSWLDARATNMQAAVMENSVISSVTWCTVYGHIEGAEVTSASGKFIGVNSNGVLKVFNPADAAG